MIALILVYMLKAQHHLFFSSDFSYTISNALVYIQDKQRQWGEDQRNLYQQQSQAKAQMLRYEDELARKRMQVCRVIFLLS